MFCYVITGVYNLMHIFLLAAMRRHRIGDADAVVAAAVWPSMSLLLLLNALLYYFMCPYRYECTSACSRALHWLIILNLDICQMSTRYNLFSGTQNHMANSPCTIQAMHTHTHTTLARQNTGYVGREFIYM